MSMADVKLADTEPRAASGTLSVRILRSSANSQAARDDRVAVEAPLEFLLHHPSLGPEPMSFGTTMRTPGDDEALAAGLLYGEGIVNQAADIEAMVTADDAGGQQPGLLMGKGVRVLVRAEDAEQAKEILKGTS